MLTVPEAAVLVHRNPETVRRWIRSGRLNATRIGTQFLIDEDELQRLVGSGKAVMEQRAPYGSATTGEPPMRAFGESPIVVHLDATHAARLVELARRIHLSPDSVARSLLSTALDQRDPDATVITAVLDAIPGAWESAQAGLAEVHGGRGIPLDDI